MQKPGKSRFSGLLLYLNGLIQLDKIGQAESRFHSVFNGPQVVNRPGRGQKEGQADPRVVTESRFLGDFLISEIRIPAIEGAVTSFWSGGLFYFQKQFVSKVTDDFIHIR